MRPRLPEPPPSSARRRTAALILAAAALACAATPAIIRAQPAAAVAAEPGVENPSAAPVVAPAPAASAPAAASPIAGAPGDLPWEVRPYVVHVSVSFSSDPVWTASRRQAFLIDLRGRLEDDLGRMWTLTLSEGIQEDFFTTGELSSLTAESAKLRWQTRPEDKIFPLVVEQDRGETKFLVREWDATSQLIGPQHSGLAVAPRLTAVTASGVVREAFRALVQIETVAGQSVALRTRAGELLPPDSTAVQLSVGDLLAPFYRQFDRKRELKRIYSPPWTLLKVEEVDRARLQSRAYTVGRIATATRRMETLAIQVRPVHSETRLRIVPRTNPGNPVAGARVDIVDRLPTGSDPVPDRLVLRSDRRGEIVVPAEPTPSIRYAIINSGQAILARVPFCPGAEASMTVDVIDDSPRLAVEGELALLEADLIELVAKRQVLLTRADTLAKQGKAKESLSLVDDLRKLPDVASFQQRIDLVRTSGVENARAKKDAVAESRIIKLCATLLSTARTHLDQDRFTETLRTLEETAKVRADLEKK